MWLNNNDERKAVKRRTDNTKTKRKKTNEQTVIYKTLHRKEEFEDTKGVIRIRKSQKDRQHNGQKKKDKGTNSDLQNTT